MYILTPMFHTCDTHQPAGVMKEPHLAVKWGLENVSASHNLLDNTVIAVLKDTITILSVFVSFILFIPNAGFWGWINE